MLKSKFTIDALDGDIFDGFTEGESWNGWACPYFTFEQAQLIVDAHRRRGLGASYDVSLDQFVFAIDGSDERDAFPATKIQSTKLYPIGAFCWIWEETTGPVMNNG